VNGTPPVICNVIVPLDSHLDSVDSTVADKGGVPGHCALTFCKKIRKDRKIST